MINSVTFWVDRLDVGLIIISVLIINDWEHNDALITMTK